MLLRSVPRALAGLLVALAVLLAGCSASGPAPSGAATSGPASPGPHVPALATPSWAQGLGVVRESALPAEARRTLGLIDRGGPFPYSQDGVVFGNFERRLPQRPRGYYHEYTVRTPGSRDRGARRIVTGQGGEIYYTDDHYDSFRAVLK
ncbi:ribonuclease domain-containing protein [Streptomyces sp. NPDC046985]|uniref:ribonuclease domain-containing protein n=1 Tax=Streptomyces sp. NPDC046985 TaxID=3155377 RepID=UPI0033BFD575